MLLCSQNKNNIHTDIYLLRNTCTFPSAYVMHHLNITVLSSVAEIMNTVCLTVASTFSGTLVHKALFCYRHLYMYNSGVPVKPVSQNYLCSLKPYVWIHLGALTCIHHKPPAWEGMSQGALPRCSVSTRRRASAGHGWMTWRSDR